MLGKRKTSIANILLTQGTGQILINKKNFTDYCKIFSVHEIIHYPFSLVHENFNHYNLIISVTGGGISSQMSAITYALAKSLCLINENYRCILKKALLLRRDARIKERRKYGLKKARKAPQYSKR